MAGGEQKDACPTQGRRSHRGPTLELYSCCLCSCARPGSGMSPGASPPLSLLPRPQMECRRELLLCVLPPQTHCSALDAHPLARFPPALKSMHLPIGEVFSVHRCPCAASDRHYFTFHSHSIHSDPPGLVPRGRERLSAKYLMCLQQCHRATWLQPAPQPATA